MTDLILDALVVAAVLLLVVAIAAAMVLTPSHDESGTGSWNDVR